MAESEFAAGSPASTIMTDTGRRTREPYVGNPLCRVNDMLIHADGQLVIHKNGA
ncbi:MULTISPECIES: hypothetical protein [unclassified Escherichia]|uniref:hypothetical protein n=1 Tax=unclassified Escherichia TaxID=2608889 RepID=UPI0013EECAD2|nr:MULTISPECIES: hypothetical protein [unclassified Escherichia]